MSKRYPGNFITGNPVALSQSSNNGIWDIRDNYQATGNNTWQEADGYYEISKSLRFRRAANSYLTRTPTVAGNRTTWTWSGWVKFGPQTQYSDFALFHAGSSDTNRCALYWDLANSQLHWGYRNSSTWVYYFDTAAKFRDHSAWYHVVLAFDTNNPIAADRNRLYVNGVRQAVTETGTAALGATSQVNNTDVHSVGVNYYYNTTTSLDGYLTEVNFVDGIALEPTAFGYTDPVTNIWQPKPYTGAYGTNGFYLPFKDNQTTYNLAKNFGAPSNYFPYAGDLTNTTYWALQGISNVKNALGPFGNMDAYTSTCTSAGYSPLYRTYYGGAAPVANMLWCVSIYAKAGTLTSFPITIGDDGLVNKAWLNVNLSNGTIDAANTGSAGTATNVTYGIKNVGNGWYRIWVSAQLGATTQCRTDFGGGRNLNDTVYLYGPQLNPGAFPDDSYVHTAGSVVTSDWTPVNFSLTSGATYDSMVDSPTNVFTNATDVGGVVPGNYATLNPLDTRANLPTFLNADLTVVGSIDNRHTRSTIGVTTGKWYWEITCLSSSPNFHHGIMAGQAQTQSGLDFLGNYSNEWAYWPNTAGTNTGYWRNNGAGPVYGDLPRAAQNDVLMFALDVDAGKIWLGINGTWFKSGAPASGTNPLSSNLPANGTPIFPAFMQYDNTGVHVNFGQRAFSYTPPTGFKSINTTNMQVLGTSVVGKAAITPNKYFDTTVYNGTEYNKDITNAGFQPDLVWIKDRNAVYHHYLFDSARGTGNRQFSSQGVVDSYDSSQLVAFKSNGFSLAAGTGTNSIGHSNVAWQWKQSPNSGFNIITYTGDGAATRSISHNLGAAPALIMCKQRDYGSDDWRVWHKDLVQGASGQMLRLNTTAIATYDSQRPTGGDANNITITGNAASYINYTGSNYLAYVWAEVPGFSKFGQWNNTNANDGTFVYTGFRPACVLIKNTNDVECWYIIDNKRKTYNVAPGSETFLQPNTTATDAANNASTATVDFLSNGFKIRTTNPASGEISFGTRNYVYGAWAESPFALNNRAK